MIRDYSLVCCCLLALLCAGLSGYVMWQPQTQIVTVRIAALTQSAVQTMARTPGSMADKTKQIASYAHRLDHTIAQLAQKNHWVVVPDKAVIAGARDVTDQVQRKLAVHP